MKLIQILRTAAVMAAALVFLGLNAGCGSTKVTNQESVGKQLLDLEKAHKDGIITDKEYERMKKKIVKEHD